MMKNITKIITAISLFFALSIAASAGNHDHEHETNGEASLFKGVFKGLYESETGKLLDLANEFSEEQMNWTPAEGVFTVQEILLHVASANYFLGSILGGDIPEGIDPKKLGETVKGKEATIATLKASISHIQTVVANVDPKALAEEVEFFGQNKSKMAVAMMIAGHSFEHLGQLIAYARSNGIVPPWSRPQSDN